MIECTVLLCRYHTVHVAVVVVGSHCTQFPPSRVLHCFASFSCVCLGAQLKFALGDSSSPSATSVVVRDAPRRAAADKGKGMLFPKGGIPDVGGMVSVGVHYLCAAAWGRVGASVHSRPKRRRRCGR